MKHSSEFLLINCISSILIQLVFIYSILYKTFYFSPKTSPHQCFFFREKLYQG